MSKRRARTGVTQLTGELSKPLERAGSQQGRGRQHRFDLNFFCLLFLFQDKKSKWVLGKAQLDFSQSKVIECL